MSINGSVAISSSASAAFVAVQKPATSNNNGQTTPRSRKDQSSAVVAKSVTANFAPRPGVPSTGSGSDTTSRLLTTLTERTLGELGEPPFLPPNELSVSGQNDDFRLSELDGVYVCQQCYMPLKLDASLLDVDAAILDDNFACERAERVRGRVQFVLTVTIVRSLFVGKSAREEDHWREHLQTARRYIGRLAKANDDEAIITFKGVAQLNVIIYGR
jgi:hypothetical protein